MSWFEIWVVIMIVGFVVEIFTTQLISIWFAISALINLFLNAVHVDVKWQLIQFIVTGIILLIIFRPLVKKIQPKFQPMNAADGIVGKNGIVLDNQRVKVEGQSWKYSSAMPLNIGDKIKVLELDGVTLKVEKINSKEG